jgi:hypothetical protein
LLEHAKNWKAQRGSPEAVDLDFEAPQGCDGSYELGDERCRKQLGAASFNLPGGDLASRQAIEMADKVGEGRSAAATASASASQRLKIQTDLGKALMWSRGFGAEESR